MNRKEFLKYSGLGALALGLTPSPYCTGPGPQKQLANPSLKPTENFNPDPEVELTAVTDEVRILPGEKTRVYTYLAEVTHGDQSRVATVNNSYIGPVLRVRRGQKIRINFHNQLQYLEHGRMTRMTGFFGDTILVNGKTGESQVAANAYRMRIINGSNARIYKLAWSDQTPLVVIGTDGGLLEEPVSKPYLMLAPGERAEA